VSIDLFVGGLAIGASGIRVSFLCTFVINIVGKVLVGTALICGYYLGAVIPEIVGVWCGFIVLCGLGLYKIGQGVRRTKGDDTKPKTLTIKSSAFLGFVLALDNAVSGFGATLGYMPFAFIWVVLALMLVTDQVVFLSANRLGGLLSQKRHRKINPNILAGVFLVVVAVTKLVFSICL